MLSQKFREIGPVVSLQLLSATGTCVVKDLAVLGAHLLLA